MKNKLKEYIPLSESKRKQIWKKGIFVLDANVLLNMCRYSKQSSDELIGIIENHKDKLWLPYQVGMEFFNNRIGVIEGIKNGFNQLLANVGRIDEILNEQLYFNKFRSDTAHNLDQLRLDITNFRKREEAKIRKWQKEFEESDKDAILNKILSLYNGKVGDDYNEAKLKELYSEGEKREKENIPPGYADWNDKIKKGIRHACGDLIWWKQAIDYARDNKCDLVIVTDDKKDDWWYKISGKTIGPRVELIREFDKETKGQAFLMYKTHQFMEMAKQLDGATVSDSSIKEAKETGAIDYSRVMGSYKSNSYIINENSPLSKYFSTSYHRSLGNPLLADSIESDPSGMVGTQGLTVLTDRNRILGEYDPSTHSAFPRADGISGLVGAYSQNPYGKVTLASLTGMSDEANKWVEQYNTEKDIKK